jgi:hypothetical protein
MGGETGGEGAEGLGIAIGIGGATGVFESSFGTRTNSTA